MRSLLGMKWVHRMGGLSVAGLLLAGCVSDDLDWSANDRPYGGTNLHPLRVAHGRAVVERCGDWSENLANSSSLTMNPDHGCAVQANRAAMMSDASDIKAKPRLGRRNSALDIEAIDSAQTRRSGGSPFDLFFGF
jgi:hypothetical protein